MELFTKWKRNRLLKVIAKGRSLAGEGKCFRAISKFKKALNLMEESDKLKRASVFENLGDAYLELDDWEEACAAYREAVANDGNNGAYWFILGQCYAQLGQNDDARVCFVQSFWLVADDVSSLRSGVYQLKSLGFTDISETWEARALNVSSKDAWSNDE